MTTARKLRYGPLVSRWRDIARSLSDAVAKWQFDG